MPRYHAILPYVIESSYSHSIDGNLVEVIVEIADLHDMRTGDTFRQGAYRVRVSDPGKVLPEPIRAKSFQGESAWMNAERHAGDIRTKLLHLR